VAIGESRIENLAQESNTTFSCNGKISLQGNSNVKSGFTLKYVQVCPLALEERAQKNPFGDCMW